MIVCQSAPPASAPEPRLTARSMLSLRDRGLAGLLDRVVQRRVAVRVTAAGARRDLDVLDQLGEQLAALGVDDGLLVLGGRPFGVAAHGSMLRSCAVLTMSQKYACTRRVPGQLRVERRGQQVPCRTATILPACSPVLTCPIARSPVGPTSLHPRRPDEDRAHRRARRCPSTSRSSSNESTCRPNALRRTVMSMPPKVASIGDAAGVDRGRRAGSSRRTSRRTGSPSAIRRRAAARAARRSAPA